MIPTPRLRWVEREIEIKSNDGFVTLHQTTRVLQQWFYYHIDYPTGNGEWKDVPVEKEK